MRPAASPLTALAPLLALTPLLALLLATPASAHLSIIRQGVESADLYEINDEHGRSVAAGDFNGDGFDDLAMGAPGETLGALASAGAVTVSWGSPFGISHLGADFLTEADFSAAQANSDFGWALAAGDFNADGHDDLAVGCPGSAAGAGGPNRGAVYVYYGSAVGLVPVHDLTQADAGGVPEANDRFGASLATGNFDGDFTPYDDLAVGVIGEDSNAGAIAWFAGGSLGLLSGPDGQIRQSDLGGTNLTGDAFGYSLAAAQVIGLYYDDLVVGIPGKSKNGLASAGEARLIFGGPSGLTTTSRVYDATTGDLGSSYTLQGNFGYEVAAGRFYGGDYAGIAISEPGKSHGVRYPKAGRVCVGKGGATAVDWTGPEAIILTEESADMEVAPDEFFGRALAAGFFDAPDGYEDLAIGTPLDDPGIENAGLVLLAPGGPHGPGHHGWSSFYQATCNDPSEPNDFFGLSLALGVFDGTGKGNLAAGAPGQDLNKGMVHVIAPWRQKYNLTFPRSIAVDCEDNLVFSCKAFDETCIASTTKAMTLLLACERVQLPPNHPLHASLDDTYTVPFWVYWEIGGSLYNFDYQEAMTLRDLLYAMMFPSGNDASYAIADMLTGANNEWQNQYAGTCQAFIDEMNARAAALGMTDTFFTNPAGLDVWIHHSTAADMMKLTRAVMENDLAASVVGATEYTIHSSYYDVNNDRRALKTVTLHNGFLMNLQDVAGSFCGVKGGCTPCAQITGLLAAKTENELGVALAGTFGSGTNLPASLILADVANLMELGLAECNTQLIFYPDLPPLRFDFDGLSTLLDDLTGAGILIERGATELPAVQLDLLRATPGAPTSALIELVRTSETTFDPQGQVPFGMTPFEGHGEIVFRNQGETPARFRVFPSYQGGYVEFFLAPGEHGVLPAHQEPLPLFTMSIENWSGGGAPVPMQLTIEEAYTFDLPSIPGEAGRILQAEIVRGQGTLTDGFQLRVRGTDPNGGPVLYAIAHDAAATVDAPDADAGEAALGPVVLRPARPNPFQGSTRLGFDLRVPGRVALELHDVQGRRVRTFAQERVAPGAWSVVWDGTREDGTRAPAGVYFYRVLVNGRQEAEGTLTRVE